MNRRFWFTLEACMILASVAFTQQPQSTVDTTAMTAIKEEALKHSEVMTTLSYLTDVYGPRLTWSP